MDDLNGNQHSDTEMNKEFFYELCKDTALFIFLCLEYH
jgi:hypothetical protein